MDDEKTAPQRTCVTARLRDVAEYSFGSDLISRMEAAKCWQSLQRAALLEAADEIDRLRQELAK